MLRHSGLLSGLAGLLTAVAGLVVAPPALASEEGDPSTESGAVDGVAAQDDDDEGDALDDILNDEESTRQEVDDVRSGNLDDSIGVRQEDIVLPEEDLKKKRLIKTLQKKNFLKLGRVEAGVHAGAVANDPFLNRYIIGATVGYHLTEVFSLEADLGFSPDLGDDVDWKPLTHQLVENNHVSPDISKLGLYGSFGFGFSPIYGKVAVGHRIIIFDIFGVFGAGLARTADDLDALQADPGDIAAEASANQFHPTTNLGGGLRIVLSPSFAVRLEGRSLVYIETVQSTTLEMKNNLILQATATFFFPGMSS